MKLPSLNRMGVQSLGREDVGAPARAWRASVATQQLTYNAASTLATDLVGMKNKYDVSKADAHVISTMTDLQAKYAGQEYYDVNDDKISKLDFNRLDEFGKNRTRVPAHEVYPQLYRQASEQAIKEGQAMISFQDQRGEWTGQYTVKAQENNAKIESQSQKKEIQFNTARQDDIYRNQMEMGQYDAAMQTADKYLGSGIKADSMKIKAGVKKEDTKTAAAINSQDATKIKARAEELEDLSKPNILSDEVRLVEATRLNKIAKIQESQDTEQQAFSWVQDSVGKGKSLGQLLKEAKQLPDAGVSKSAQSTIRQYMADNERANDKYKAQAFNDLFAQLVTPNEDGTMPRYADLPASKLEVIGSASALQLLEVSKKPAATFSDDQYQVEQQYINHWTGVMGSGDADQMKNLANLNIDLETRGWSNQARADALRLQSQASKAVNTRVTPKGSSLENIKKRVIQAQFKDSITNLSGDNLKDANQLIQMIDAEIALATTDKEIGSVQTQEIVDKIVNREYVNTNWVNTDVPLHTINIDGVSGTGLLVISDYTQQMGLEPTDTNLERVKRLMDVADEQGLPINADTLAVLDGMVDK